jgi:hypothetical protein
MDGGALHVDRENGFSVGGSEGAEKLCLLDFCKSGLWFSLVYGVWFGLGWFPLSWVLFCLLVCLFVGFMGVSDALHTGTYEL